MTNQIYSHKNPDILLKDHLGYVGNRSRKIIKSKEFNSEINKNILSDTSYLIGISHDFGKSTTYFQKYLDGLYDSNKTHHGLISALFAFELVDLYIRWKKLEENPIYRFMPLIAYFAVKHHHGKLFNIKDDLNPRELFKGDFCNIKEQTEDIEKNIDNIKSIYGELLEGMKLSFDDVFEELKKYKKEINGRRDIKTLIEPIRTLQSTLPEKDISCFLMIQLLFSILIDSDKKHAGKVGDIERKKLSSDLVAKYKNCSEFKEKNVSEINVIREKIHKSVLENVDKTNIKNKIFSITAPTGTGKTLTSLSAALKLRQRINRVLSYPESPRIIYSLPFTSIIDQNFDVFGDVLEKTIEDYNENPSTYLIKHHHLAEMKYKKDNEEKPVDESLALIESWDSEIVVTTFIQLFHSIIGYQNSFLKKYHNIVNSIIILDEVQNIPIKYWRLVSTVLVEMSKLFNCRVILLTATKPLIFKSYECIELLEDHESYFRKEDLNRVKLHIDIDSITDEKGKNIENFVSELNNWSHNSYMFVFNTINSSLVFYQQIKQKIWKGNNLNFTLCYLSTNIIPKQRRERINYIKEKLEKREKIIIVTTQLIEAGVDIDVDVVYRDIGPFDSIIQVAGRCNRNKRMDNGEVHVIKLFDEDKKYGPCNIYGATLLNIVEKDILNSKSEIPESEFLELINDYFKIVSEKSNGETKIIKAIYDLYYYDKNPDKSTPISDFKLIENNYEKVDIFIELNNQSKDVWQDYLEIKAINDTFERKNEFLKIKRDYYDYVISVDKKYANNICYVPYAELENYYDKTTGFKRQNAGAGSLII